MDGLEERGGGSGSSDEGLGWVMGSRLKGRILGSMVKVEVGGWVSVDS